jgi:hypothetical protein
MHELEEIYESIELFKRLWMSDVGPFSGWPSTVKFEVKEQIDQRFRYNRRLSIN